MLYKKRCYLLELTGKIKLQRNEFRQYENLILQINFLVYNKQSKWLVNCLSSLLLNTGISNWKFILADNKWNSMKFPNSRLLSQNQLFYGRIRQAVFWPEYSSSLLQFVTRGLLKAQDISLRSSQACLMTVSGTALWQTLHIHDSLWEAVPAPNYIMDGTTSSACCDPATCQLHSPSSYAGISSEQPRLTLSWFYRFPFISPASFFS